MSLEVNKQAALHRLYERINPCIGRLCEDNVATGGKFIFSDFIPSGMWEAHAICRVTEEWMIGIPDRIENTELFVRERMTLDSRAMQHAGMRRETGKNG